MMRIFLAAILVAATAACSSAPTTPASAAEAFQRIEERIAKAKTLSVTFQVVGMQAGKGEKGEMKGSIQLKEGNRARVETTAEIAGPVEALWVSDGRTMRWGSMGKTNDKEAPRDLGERLRIGFARGGYQGIAMEKFRLSGSQEAPGPQAFEIRDLQKADDDGSLTYTLSFPAGGETTALKVQLWYNARTWDLTKRRFLFPAQGQEVVITETYDVVALDGGIPDNRFSLSAPPPPTTGSIPIREHRSFEWWSGHKPGSWAKYQGQLIVAGTGKIESTSTLQEITDNKAVVASKTIMTSPRGQAEPESVEKLEYSMGGEKDPIKVLKEGDEEIEVAGKKLKCHWIEGTRGNNKVKMWLSKEIPGGLARTREIFVGHVSGIMTLTAVAWEKK